MGKIDIVIPWVDGSDPEWQKLRQQYAGEEDFGNNDQRFRDWDLLKYWFRGVEKNAPWVNRIHFITCGHLPAWLNTNHPKLHVVNHKDYIPEEYLPTFSSNPIELNIHRIDELSEKFIYFNDDLYIIGKVSPKGFFYRDIPKSAAGLAVSGQTGPEFESILLADSDLINRHFISRDVLRRHFFKFFHRKYGIKQNLKNLLLLPYCWYYFPGFYNAHTPNAYLKSTFAEVWGKASHKLSDTCSHKFRTPCDVNQYVFLWWQWCKGLVVPQNVCKLFTYLSVFCSDEQISDVIKNKKTPMIAVNDDWCENFEQKKVMLKDAFDTILGEKSSFEL